MFRYCSFESKYFLSRSIGTVDGSLQGTSTPGQNSPGNEGVLHLPQFCITPALPTDVITFFAQGPLFGQLLTAGDTISKFLEIVLQQGIVET